MSSMIWKASPSRCPNRVIAGKLSSIRVGAHRAQTHRASQNRSGLVLVNKLQLAAFDFFAFGLEIGHLTGDQFLAACRDCDLAQQH